MRVLRVRVDRHRCIGAGNCITIAPTAFDWLKGDLGKADVVDAESAEEELLRAAAASCPTDAIVIEEVEALLPWQLRGKAGPERRVLKTFMFTDIVKSTNLADAMGDDAWLELLRWHDETLRSSFASHNGEEVGTTGDGFFVVLRQPRRRAGVCRRDPAPVRRPPPAARVRSASADRAARIRSGAGGGGLPRQGRPRGVADCSPGRGRGDRREQGHCRIRLPVPGIGAADRHAQGDLRARGDRLDRLALIAQPAAAYRAASSSSAIRSTSKEGGACETSRLAPRHLAWLRNHADCGLARASQP